MAYQATSGDVPRRYELSLQARSRWFEPTCAHQVSQLDGLFRPLIGNSVTTAGNHRCMLTDGEGCPAAKAASLSTARTRLFDASASISTGSQLSRLLRKRCNRTSGMPEVFQDW